MLIIKEILKTIIKVKKEKVNLIKFKILKEINKKDFENSIYFLFFVIILGLLSFIKQIPLFFLFVFQIYIFYIQN